MCVFLCVRLCLSYIPGKPIKYVTSSRNLLKVGYACFVSVHACACVSVFVCVLPSFTLPSGYFHIISF